MRNWERGNWRGELQIIPYIEGISAKELAEGYPALSFDDLKVRHEKQYIVVWRGRSWLPPSLADIRDGIGWAEEEWGRKPDYILPGYPQAGDKLFGVEIA